MQPSKWGINKGQKDLESTQEFSCHYPEINFKVIVHFGSLVTDY